jgi:hypothetical protein
VSNARRYASRSVAASRADWATFRFVPPFTSMSTQDVPVGSCYGLGVAWGASLTPAADGEIRLCTPDTLLPAIEMMTTPSARHLSVSRA